MKRALLMFFCIAIPAYLLSNFFGLADYLNLLGPTQGIIKIILLAGFVFIMVEFWRSDTTSDDKLFWTIGTLICVPIALPLMYFNKLQPKTNNLKESCNTGTTSTRHKNTSTLNQANKEVKKDLGFPQKAAHFCLSAPIIAWFVTYLTNDATKESKFSHIVVYAISLSLLLSGFCLGVYSLAYSKKQKKIIIPAAIGISFYLIIGYIAYATLNSH